MNVLLINPPFLKKFSREQRSPAVTKSGTFYYPMWLCYAAGVLEERGHAVKVLDCPAADLSWDDIEHTVRQHGPRLVVVDTSTPSIHSDTAAAARVKAAAGGAFTVLVGPHVTALPEESLALEPSVDAVALQEYELTMAELAEALERGGDPAAVPGMVVRRGGGCVRTPDRPLCQTLDRFPFVSAVYKRHLDHRAYFYSHSTYPIVTIITGRGCPFQCVYCVYPQVFCGHKPRLRSVARVADEIEYILREFPDVREIMFEDDTLTFDKNRCLEFAHEVIRRRLRFQWSANSRCDIDLETMRLLRKAGARLFCVGVESGDQAVLDRMRKSLKVERIVRFFRDARRAGIKIHGCFMVGNPGETPETLEKTLAFAKELNPDTAQFFPIMVYPGTEAYRWATDDGLLVTGDFRGWLTPDGQHRSIVSRPGLSNDELVAFCDRARREFYLRPSYIVRKLGDGLRDPGELQRLAKGFINLSRHLARGTGR